MDLTPTPSQTVGPFFHFSLASPRHRVARIAGPDAKGERIWIECRVIDGEGAPIDDAMIEIWQADAAGRFSPVDPLADRECGGFGRLATDEKGSCEFETIRPGRVPGPDGAPQAPHLEVAVFARGMLKQLFTRIYFADDPANQEDPVLALVPDDRRQTLLARPDPSRPSHWHFDLALQGENETVFFDA